MTGDNGRFKTPFRRKPHYSKFVVDEKVISNPERLLSAWVYHVDNKHSPYNLDSFDVRCKYTCISKLKIHKRKLHTCNSKCRQQDL